MILSFILFFVGLAMVVFGSDFLVDGASCVARKLKISEFVIGIIIVGFGTSCPELVVSITGALEGSSDIAIGNVIGSNILNILLILGLTAVISPIAITRDNKSKDIPILLTITLFFCLTCLDGEINRLDAIIYLLLFTAYIVYNFRSGKKNPDEEGEVKQYSLGLSIIMILAGLGGLIFGGKLFVDNAVKIAQGIGASEKFIAITVLALGTSLPELVTCVVAAAKKKGQLALGNIVGSNVFNILLILGCAGIINPLNAASLNYVDMAVTLASALLLFLFAFTSKKQKISKGAGFTMLALELAYMIFLFIKL